MVALQRCRSHERNSTPKAWEDYEQFASVADAGRAYAGLPHAMRMESDWRAIDEGGAAWDTVEIMEAAFLREKPTTEVVEVPPPPEVVSYDDEPPTVLSAHVDDRR